MCSRFGYTTPSKSQSIYPAPPKKKSYAYEKFNKKYQQLRNKIPISSTVTNGKLDLNRCLSYTVYDR